MTVPLSAFRVSPNLVRYAYYLTDFQTGRLRGMFPLWDASLPDALNGAASASFEIRLADRAARSADPFSATIPRRSCMWAERQELDPASNRLLRADTMWGGVIMGRSRPRGARSLKVDAVTWPGYLARRLVGDRLYRQADKFTIARQLVQGAVDFTTELGGVGLYPNSPHLELVNRNGYTQDASGVLADRTYQFVDQRYALDAIKQLASSGDGFDWRMVPLRRSKYAGVGENFAVRLDLGYPRLGRIKPAGLRWSARRSDSRSRWGWVEDYTVEEDGTGVNNRVTAIGSGSGPTQIRATADEATQGRQEYFAGYPLYDGSTQSSSQELVTQAGALAAAQGALAAGFASEFRVSGIKVRGDLAPVVTSYALGDDVTLLLDENTTGQPLTVTGQLISRTILPPQQGRTEQVTMEVQGTAVAA